jgi:hypothetical protein
LSALLFFLQIPQKQKVPDTSNVGGVSSM